MNSILSAEGTVVDAGGERRGWVISENGVVTDAGYGDCPVDPDVTGFILRDVVNMHTHCADFGLEVPPGLSLEELVAPPDGLKHRYLRNASPEKIAEDMRRFGETSRGFGSETFVDFREGGLNGCRMLRSACPDAVILGRPISPVFDADEVCSILEIADGIGISSVSDMDPGYIEEVADAVRERRKVFAIHVSERIREDIDLVLSMDPAFVVHMCEATDEDILKCAEAEVPIVVCPTSNRYFGREPPIARAQRLGADLALGTDNGMLCQPDLLSEAAAFACTAKGQGGDPDECLRALTRVTGKILNRSRADTWATGPGPVTVLPSVSQSAAEAVGNRDQRIRLNIRRF